MNGWFGRANGFMCALFLLAVVVQWNDPDPILWMAIYGAALAVCLVVTFRGRVPMVGPALVLLVALVWGVNTMFGGPAASAYAHMFDAWEMRSSTVEVARESSGLLIVAAWMLSVIVSQPRGGK